MALGDARAAQASEASTRRPHRLVELVLVVGQLVGATSIRTWFSDASLSSPISCRSLGNDRDLAHLGQERLGELVDLGGSGCAAGEDPEVDTNLDPGGSASRTQNASCGSTLIYKSYCPLSGT